MEQNNINNQHQCHPVIKDLNVNIKYEYKSECIDEIIEINHLRKIDLHRGIWKYSQTDESNVSNWAKILEIALKSLSKGYNLVVLCRLIEALISINTIEGLHKSLQIINKSPEKQQLEEWANKHLLTCIYRNPIFYPISKKEIVVIHKTEFEKFHQLAQFTKSNIPSLYEKIQIILRFLKPKEEYSDLQDNLDKTQEKTYEVNSESYPEDQTSQKTQPIFTIHNMTTEEKYQTIEDIIDSILKTQKQDLIANMVKNLMKLKSKGILEIINITNWKEVLFSS